LPPQVLADSGPIKVDTFPANEKTREKKRWFSWTQSTE
jgi:hypothetical protein